MLVLCNVDLFWATLTINYLMAVSQVWMAIVNFRHLRMHSANQTV